MVFSLSPDVIKQALRIPTSTTYVSFKDAALAAQFIKQPRETRRAFISSITIDQAASLSAAEPFPLSLFVEEVRPILSLIAGLLGVGSPEDISTVCVHFLWLMSQKGVVLDIHGFLSTAIQTQFQELP